MTRYEAEMIVRDVVDELIDEYDLEDNFYGDCYPQEVLELENRLERTNNQEEIDEIIKEVIDIFKSYID